MLVFFFFFLSKASFMRRLLLRSKTLSPTRNYGNKSGTSYLCGYIYAFFFWFWFSTEASPTWSGLFPPSITRARRRRKKKLQHRCSSHGHSGGRTQYGDRLRERRSRLVRRCPRSDGRRAAAEVVDSATWASSDWGGRGKKK